MTASDSPTDQGTAEAIADEYLSVLSGGSAAQLRQCLGSPVDQLLMGQDGRPYLITVAAVRSPAGGLCLSVSVDDCGWDGEVAVMRSAVLSFTGDGCRRK